MWVWSLGCTNIDYICSYFHNLWKIPDFGFVFIYLPSSIIFTCFPGENHYSNLHSYLSVFILYSHMALVKNPPVNEGYIREAGLISAWVGKIPWWKAWQAPLVSLPGESPWTEEAGRIQSIRLQRVGHYWSTLPPWILYFMICPWAMYGIYVYFKILHKYNQFFSFNLIFKLLTS